MESSKLSLQGLGLAWLILQRRWFPATTVFLSFLTVGIVATNLKKPIYSATGKLQYKNIDTAASIIDSEISPKKNNDYTSKNHPIDTEIEIIRSQPIVEETLNQLNWQDEQGNSLKPKQFLEKLTINNLLGTELLSISYQDRDPAKAAEAVNTVMSVFLKQHLFANRAEIVATREFIEKQLPQAKETLAQAELAVRKFQENNKIIALENETAQIMAQFNNLEQQITDIQSEIVNTNRQSQAIERKLGITSEQAVTLATLNQNRAIGQLSEQIQQLESQLAIERDRFTDASPQIIASKQELASLKVQRSRKIQQLAGKNGIYLFNQYSGGELQQELARELVQLETTNKGLKAKIAELSQVQGKYKKTIVNLPQIEQKLHALHRELEIAQTTYSLLLQKLQEVRIAENQNIGNFQVVTKAHPPAEPIPYRALNYLASSLLASLAAAATIYVLEATDKSIKTVDEAKNLFGYNWLGIIPAVEESEIVSLVEQNAPPLLPQQIVLDYPSSSVGESYRMLQSNLEFLSSDQNLKTIVITSSASGEGKSTVAANLAAAMAQVGHRVLLIDGDLHHPSQHQIWEIDNNFGLSNIISEQLDPRLAIREVSLNLDVLTAGTVPVNPATLLDSHRMGSLLDYLSLRYDLVLIDTPSLDFTADAPILGRLADGVLLVVKPGQVDHNKAQFAKEILAQSGQNVLGIIINGVSSKAEPNKYYYHALEAKHDISRPFKVVEQAEEELWQAVSRMARESRKQNLPMQMDLTDLSNVSLDQLLVVISHLEKDLANFTQLVREQEEELALQKQKVRRLERKIHISSRIEKIHLEQELIQEQEIKQLLDKTLIGQRRNLANKNQILRQYQQLFSIGQNKLIN
ncbi:MAG: polysaccharide biosynthesis tyrosine autokinase [Xenococcaceae cyanobacterium MO_188.B29]|nr:polysaccharide biosynthesis tyrosine autokinase [Xenococcaceae cyanobacterium MO_188.B29]